MPGERRWLHLCGANEVHWVKVRRRERGCGYLSHLSLSSTSVFSFIWSSQLVSSTRGGGVGGLAVYVCALICVCCVFMCVIFLQTGVKAWSKGQSVKRSTRRVTMIHLMAGMTATWHFSGHTRACESCVVVIKSFNRYALKWTPSRTKEHTQHACVCACACIWNPRSIGVSLNCSCVCLSSAHGKHIRDSESANAACWNVAATLCATQVQHCVAQTCIVQSGVGSSKNVGISL